MKVLVTGGTGQVGGAVARALLARGDEVRCIVRNPNRLANLTGVDAELVAGDVTDIASLRAACDGIEAVVHAAGVVSYWKPRYPAVHHVNVEGTRFMLDAAADAGVKRFVLTSSIAALGWVHGDSVGDETTAWNWQGQDIAYMDTKFAAQQLVLAESRMETLAVNPGIVLGAGDVAENGLRMLLQIHDGSLPGVPPGRTTCCVLDDVVQGHLAALEKGRAQECYVLGGTTGSFRDIFGRMGTALGKQAPTRELPAWALHLVARGHVLKARFTQKEPRLTPALVRVTTRNRQYRSDKAMRELDYTPSPLESGIEAAWAWAKAEGKVPAHT